MHFPEGAKMAPGKRLVMIDRILSGLGCDGCLHAPCKIYVCSLQKTSRKHGRKQLEKDTRNACLGFRRRRHCPEIRQVNNAGSVGAEGVGGRRLFAGGRTGLP